MREVTNHYKASLNGFYDYQFLASWKDHMKKTDSLEILEYNYDKYLKQKYNFDKSFNEMMKSETFVSSFSLKYPQLVFQTETVEQAYENCDVQKDFHRIKTPTLLMMAENDPILG